MLVSIAFKNLRRNPRRTVASMLTVAVGTAALALFNGFNAGIMNQYRDNTVHARFGHGQVNTKGYRDQVFEKPWEHWLTDPGAVLGKLKSLPQVSHVFPRIDFFALLTNGQISVSGRGQGILGPAEAGFFNTINVVEGDDLRAREDGILMGIGLARALDVKAGDTVTVLGNTIYGSINGLDLTVTGIFHTGLKEVDDALFKIQLGQAQALLDTDRVESIALGLTGYDAWPAFAKSFAATLPGLEATPFEVLDKVYYQHAVDWLSQQFYVIELIILMIITLGIGNTLSFTVLERKREIGNLRANGESVGDVMRLLLTEGFFLGSLGALAGAVSAWLVAQVLVRQGILMPPAPGITRQYHVKIELGLQMTLTAMALGLTTALIATAIAGRKVVRLPIGEALRSN